MTHLEKHIINYARFWLKSPNRGFLNSKIQMLNFQFTKRMSSYSLMERVSNHPNYRKASFNFLITLFQDIFR